jgi:ATP-dependent Clp protease ATP-binding subunit ClpC
MLERFTERARRVLILATEEARIRRHETVGHEHLLMGILRDGGGDFAVHSLEQLGVSPETLRAEVERVLSETPGSATGANPHLLSRTQGRADRHPHREEDAYR